MIKRPSFLSSGFISSIVVLTVFLTGVIAAVPAFSQKRSKAQSQTLAAPTGRIPEIIQDSLPNGLHILFTRLNDLPLAEISVIVDAGIGMESEDEYGAAYGVAQLLLSGSKERTGDMVSTYASQLGSVLIPYVHYDYSQLYGKTLTKNFSATLGLIADAVIAPEFPTQALLRLQQQSSVRLFRQISSGEHATITTVQHLCGSGHAMSRFIQPTTEEVNALSVERLRAFHTAWYQPKRTTVIVTGNLDYKFVRTSLIEAFGKWENGEEVQRPVISPGTITPAVVVIADSLTPNGLAYFRVGGRGVLRNEKDFAPQMLLNNILSNGAQSRLSQMMWGKHVISPNFSTAVAFSKDCSYFMISGSASPNSSDSVLLFLQEVIVDIARNGVTETELAASKATLLADESLIFATNRNLQSLLKEATVYGLSIEQSFSFSTSIRQVSVKDIQRIAQEVLLPEHLQTVVLGSEEKIVPLMKAMGKNVRITE
ncbi:MAG: pitrilysin family protein [Bacteroidota bacterium]